MDEDGQGSRLRTLVGLGLVIVAVLGVLFVVRELRRAAAVEECLASGRRNCVPVATNG
jgi:hypothetical protein